MSPSPNFHRSYTAKIRFSLQFVFIRIHSKWCYDIYGRTTNKVDAANNLILTYQYDPGSRLTNRWSAAKGATVYHYDALGNLTNVNYSGGTVAMANVSLAYDALNRLTSIVDGVGTTSYGYDGVEGEPGWFNQYLNKEQNNKSDVSGIMSGNASNLGPITRGKCDDGALINDFLKSDGDYKNGNLYYSGMADGNF